MEEIEDKVYTYISAKRLTKPLIILFLLFLLASIGVIYLAAVSAFGKLSDSAIYNLDTISEAFEYTILAKTAPAILLERFTPLKHSCSSMQINQQYYGGKLSLNKGTKILIERKSTGHLMLTATSINNASQQTSKSHSIGTFINKFERCQLFGSVVFEVQLDAHNQVFSMNIDGKLKIGRTLSDATDSYYPLVKSGQIIIQDKTIFTKSQISLSPQLVRPGDTLQATDARGIIRASHEESGLIGVFHQQGNKILLSRMYSEEPDIITPTFFDRVINDNELAFALSATLVVIQFIGFGISTLLRLALFPSPTTTRRHSFHRKMEETNEKA